MQSIKPKISNIEIIRILNILRDSVKWVIEEKALNIKIEIVAISNLIKMRVTFNKKSPHFNIWDD